jgi:iron complex outermembrane receptor protein
MTALLLGASLVTCSAAAAAQTAPPAAKDDPAATQLGEVVVTAQRREESLQKVPVAVTAFSAQQIEQLRVVNVRKLDAVAPNLQINNQGSQSNPTVVIRGVASGVSNNAVDPKVGIYIDGVYIGRSVGSLFDLADIQRVEVLRGPQGTLFGRNATAGAISIVTAAPTGVFDGHGTASIGNEGQRRVKFSVDLPRVGPFSARISFLHDQIDGYASNLLAGRTIDLSLRDPTFGTLRYADSLGARRVNGGGLAVRGDFGDFRADYRFDYTDSRETGYPMQTFGPLTDSTGPLVTAILALQPLTGGITNLATSPLDAVAAATSEEHVVTQGHSLTLDYHVSDEITLKSITAYRVFTQDPMIFDLGASGGLRLSANQFYALLLGNITGAGGVLDPANAPGPNDSFFTLLSARSTSQRQFSQEVQLQYTGDRWSLISGLFFFHENSPASDILGVFQPVVNGVVITNPVLDPIFGSGLTQTRAINSSYAAYGQATFHVTDTIDLTGGLRYTEDNRRNIITAISGGQGAELGIGDYKARFHKLNYTAIATWRPESHTTTYAKVSTGYVSGGILSGIPYGPESLTAYELGLKTTMLDNRLRANLAGYYNDYKNLQVQNFANGRQEFQNAGSAKIQGFEAELEAIPIQGLDLSGNVGLSDFHYDQYIVNGVDIADIARPVYTSKWTAHLTASYTAPDLPIGGHAYGRIDASYKSRQYLTVTPIQQPGTGLDAPIEAFNQAPAYWLLDARIGVEAIPVAGTRIDISLYGQNLTDNRSVDFGAPVSQLVASYQRGRLWGVELGFSF